MTLSVRPIPYVVPAYSLTGDLLAYLTCGLQYRYQNRGALPPSKPVQLWFGQFIHGVMEEAYRNWQSGASPLPWSDPQIHPIVDLIVRRLAARGVYFQRYQLLGIAVERAFVSINTWGPYLFPLIAEAEVRLKSIRPMLAGTTTIRQSNYYEVEGVVDVITSVQLSTAATSNPIVGVVLDAISNQVYEVVVDYKGMRRQSIQDPTDQSWQYHEWQVMTYAWLRNQQAGTSQVRSGLLLYLNELVPGIEDMDRLWQEVYGTGQARTDLPPSGVDWHVLHDWHQIKSQWEQQLSIWSGDVRDWWKTGRYRGQAFPRMPAMPRSLSSTYVQARSFRVISVNNSMVTNSLQEFDRVVSEIEMSVARESGGAPLTRTWTPNPRDETCTVCDFRTFCPAPGNRYRGAPSAP